LPKFVNGLNRYLALIMLVKPRRRILTIGDGDLSFSNALRQHFEPQMLCATVYDPLATLGDKYGLDNYQALKDGQTQVICQFDVTKPDTWQSLPKQQFDLVIFQFPLIPNDVSGQEFAVSSRVGDANLRNRRLLHLTLKHAQAHFLDPEGDRITIITSKDVKPYRQWDIEQSISEGLTVNYLGQCSFNAADFPHYRIRNVDRDKFVKETLGTCYYYSDKPQPVLRDALMMPTYLSDSSQYCGMCRVGPMLTDGDRQAHQQSKRHQQMNGFKQRWRDYRADVNR